MDTSLQNNSIEELNEKINYYFEKMADLHKLEITRCQNAVHKFMHLNEHDFFYPQKLQEAVYEMEDSKEKANIVLDNMLEFMRSNNYSEEEIKKYEAKRIIV